MHFVSPNLNPSPPPDDDAQPSAPPLRLVFWESTAACNLACVHCRRLEVSRERSKHDLTTAQAKAMIDSLVQLDQPILVFSGGEPLMRPDFFELASYAREQGVPTALATNGTIMDDSIARQIVASGVRRVSMSFDGPDATTHDAFRGVEGAFESTRSGFTQLRRAGMSMQVNTTITRKNVAFMDRMHQLAIDLGAEALHLFMLVPVGCGMTLSDDVKLTAAEYEWALRWIAVRSRESKLHLKATCAPHYFRITRQMASEEKAGGEPTGGRDAMRAMTKGCLAGQAVCFVSHTGEVFPCGYLPVSSGNVRETPLTEIWRSSAIFAELRDDSKLEGKCGLCEYKRVCMGCRARAFAETGSYLAAEPNCAHVPVRVRRGLS